MMTETISVSASTRPGTIFDEDYPRSGEEERQKLEEGTTHISGEFYTWCAEKQIPLFSEESKKRFQDFLAERNLKADEIHQVQTRINGR